MVEQADVVLADLPCSGLGIIGKKPDIKERMTRDEIKNLAKLQREILSVVTQYVKPGGTLVYSTCTIDHLRKMNDQKTRIGSEKHLAFEPKRIARSFGSQEALKKFLRGEHGSSFFRDSIPATASLSLCSKKK
ncbi:MAG: hypothetical protein ACLUAR_00695 [Pilosibacter sp.]